MSKEAWKEDWARLRSYTSDSRTHIREVEEVLRSSPAFDLFIDCGPGNVGSEAWSIREALPDCEIIGFEPQKERYEMLAAAQYPGTLVSFAVGPKTEKKDGYMGYHNGKSDFWTRATHAHLDNQAYEKTEVQFVALQDFLTPEQKSKNIFIWADIEGAEYDMLLGAKELFTHRRIVGVLLEMHTEKSADFVKGQGRPLEVRHLLATAGLPGRRLLGDGGMVPTHCDWLFVKNERKK
tara:strand:- start:1465 stop:2172 length:708 start_codon:yes stop_codon:yes gene_type:complete